MSIAIADTAFYRVAIAKVKPLSSKDRRYVRIGEIKALHLPTDANDA